LIQYSFELINVVTGLPWFHTIIVGGIFWRLVIFPFAAAGLRNAMRMRTVSAESAAISETMAAARAKGDTVAMMRASEEAKQIRAKAGVSLGGMMAPMIQLPISLGLFLGLKKMCDLPVAQLTQSGLEWLPDLTVSGPYYILPTIVALSGNLQIMVCGTSRLRHFFSLTCDRRPTSPTRIFLVQPPAIF
jgi:YidC/Oxa1 family membrane protein insertase